MVQLPLLARYLLLQSVDLALLALLLEFLLDFGSQHVTFILQPSAFTPGELFVVDLKFEIEELPFFLLVLQIRQVQFFINMELVRLPRPHALSTNLVLQTARTFQF